MDSRRSGFTIVEVALFLALSGFLMVGLIIGAGVSIARQRYNDSVNNFAEFLRGVYSDVENVSNWNSNTTEDSSGTAGRTANAVYGKLVIIGGKDSSGNDTSEIYTYDVIGRAVNSSTLSASNTLDILVSVNADIIERTPIPGSVNIYTYAAYRKTSYKIPWDGYLDRVNGSDGKRPTATPEFRGAILVVRSPLSGTIHTYHALVEPGLDLMSGTSDLLEVEAYLAGSEGSPSNAYGLLKALINSGKFKEEQTDICINSPDNNLGNRRDVRIQQYAANSSGVFLVGLNDADESKCLGM